MESLQKSMPGDAQIHPVHKLFNDRGFRLLRVHRTWRNRTFLTVVTPAFDPNCRKDVETNGYYCISHLWGDPDKCTTWDDSGVKDTNNGKPVVARIRPEKREALMELLQSKGSSYWWVDVFCTHKDMDLGIMGDIYRNCKACYALVDIRPQTIRDYDKLTNFFNHYHDQCLLGNNHILPHLRQRFAEALKSVVEGQQCDHPDLREPMWRPFFDLPGFMVNIEHDEIDGLCDIVGAGWWRRVWTLQELLLPPIVHLVSESGPASCELALDPVKNILVSMDNFISTVDDQMDEIRQLLPPDYDWRVFRRLQGSLKRITEALCLRAAYHQQWTDQSNTAFFLDLLDHLSRSPRQCLDPRDYIYGVLGLLDMDIPRRALTWDTWILFHQQLEKKKGKLFTEALIDINLMRATCMEDVYGQFRRKK